MGHLMPRVLHHMSYYWTPHIMGNFMTCEPIQHPSLFMLGGICIIILRFTVSFFAEYRKHWLTDVACCVRCEYSLSYRGVDPKN